MRLGASQEHVHILFCLDYLSVVVGLQGVLEGPILEQQMSRELVDLGVIGVEGDVRLQISERHIAIALDLVAFRTQQIVTGLVGIHRNGHTDLMNRLLVTLAAAQNGTPEVKHFGLVLFRPLHCLVDFAHRILPLLQLAGHQCLAVEGRRCVIVIEFLEVADTLGEDFVTLLKVAYFMIFQIHLSLAQSQIEKTLWLLGVDPGALLKLLSSLLIVRFPHAFKALAKEFVETDSCVELKQSGVTTRKDLVDLLQASDHVALAEVGVGQVHRVHHSCISLEFSLLVVLS